MKYNYLRSLSLLLPILFLSCWNPSQQQIRETLDPKTGAVMVLIPIHNHKGQIEPLEKNNKTYTSHSILFMDKFEVTNAQFDSFVNETGYTTVAERNINMNDLIPRPTIENSLVADSIVPAGSMVFKKSEKSVPLNQFLDWWEWIPGASWKHPFGPESDLTQMNDHPVVHVAWEDAQAYCIWAEKRLPTEDEWAFAAKGGKENPIYPWGDEDINSGEMKANFWQGLFPVDNTLEDGFEGTAPVGSFPPNGFGLHDMAGNVWEFTSDFICMQSGKKYNWAQLDPQKQYEVIIRGGSFLCSDQYCSGYRIDQKMSTTADTGAGHLGFRCVKESINNNR